MKGRPSSSSSLALGGLAGLCALVLAIVTLASASEEPPTQILGGQLRDGSVPAVYADMIRAAATTCDGVSAPLIAAQIEAESGWNPRAVSPVGAQGLSQFMPGTWATYGVDADRDGRADPFSPADAIATQAAYDCALLAQLRPAIASGRVRGAESDLMLAAYNAGPGAVLAAGGVPAFPETTAYVARITALTAKYTAVATSAGPAGQRIVQAAQSQLGVPYAWGGTTNGPSEGFAQGAGTIGFDCSGLVLYAVSQATNGKTHMPRTADQQSRTGTPVPASQLQAGDLIAFTRPGASRAHHIGIYAGSGQMIHAPETGGVVEIVPLDTPYWRREQWQAVRVG